jgi:uncharacterized protein (DUF305 family)
VPLLVAVVALFLGACGDDESGTPSAGNGVDRAFVAEMMPHHESAVEMAEMAKERGQHKRIRRLADAIIESQSAEIESMSRLAERMDADGVKKGDLGLAHHEMGTVTDMEDLETAKPFDRAFIDAMIAHHQDAILMGQAQLAKGQNAQVKRLAYSIVDAQTKEIDAMNMWRVDWYGGLSPAGGVPLGSETVDGDDMADMGHE